MSLSKQQQLNSMASTCATKIAQTRIGIEYFDEPYKHIVIDDFLDKKLIDSCLENFPQIGDSCWEHANVEDIEIKMRTTWKSEFDIQDGIIDAVKILNSAPVLKAMGDRLDIRKLVPDPYFTGGGLNMTMPGGLLDVHVDGNYHDATGLNRRINALVYLNPGWKSEWGGEFGIYDSTGKECVKRVSPLFNRLVIFDSHDYSFHGLPEPLAFPPGVGRKSIILYYYTMAQRPSQQIAVSDPHSALWVKRQLNDKRGNKTREFE